MAKDSNVKDMIAGNTLNDYERAIYLGLTQTRGSKAVKSKIISEAVTNVMNGNVDIDGAEMSVAEALVVKVVGDALADPSTSKLKDLASIVGDVGATKVEIVSSAIDDELARAAIGEDLDGEE